MENTDKDFHKWFKNAEDTLVHALYEATLKLKSENQVSEYYHGSYSVSVFTFLSIIKTAPSRN